MHYHINYDFLWPENNTSEFDLITPETKREAIILQMTMSKLELQAIRVLKEGVMKKFQKCIFGPPSIYQS